MTGASTWAWKQDRRLCATTPLHTLSEGEPKKVNNIVTIWNFSAEVGVPSREPPLWAVTLLFLSSFQELHLEHQFIYKTHTEAAAGVAEILPFPHTFFWSCTYSQFWKQQSLERYIHFILMREIHPIQLNNIVCIATINCPKALSHLQH